MRQVQVSATQLAVWQHVMADALEVINGRAEPSTWLLDRLEDQSIQLQHMRRFHMVRSPVDPVEGDGPMVALTSRYEGAVSGWYALANRLGLEAMAWEEGDDEAVWGERAAGLVGPLTEVIEALLTLQVRSVLESELASRSPAAEWARAGVLVAVLELVPVIVGRWALRSLEGLESPLFEEGDAGDG